MNQTTIDLIRAYVILRRVEYWLGDGVRGSDRHAAYQRIGEIDAPIRSALIKAGCLSLALDLYWDHSSLRNQ